MTQCRVCVTNRRSAEWLEGVARQSTMQPCREDLRAALLVLVGAPADAAAPNWSLRGRFPGHCAPDRSDGRRPPVRGQQRTLQPPRSSPLYFFSFFALTRWVFISCHELPTSRARRELTVTATFRSPFAFCYHPVSVHLRVVQIPGYMHAGGGWWWRIRRSSNSKEKG